MQTNELLDKIFRGARSQNGWLPTPVPDSKLRELYELMKFGPTSVNCSPARLVFVRTEEGRARLRPALAPGNVEKTMAAPVVAIVGYDTRFYEHLPELFPHNPAVKAWFEGDEKVDFANTTAFRNGTLQGGYLIAAARAVGLDCGPMSGFNNQAVDQAFFAGTSIRSNFICGLGHGDPEKVFARSPRLSFDQACQLA
ncbi:putative malonic semialdehyde reductase RutE [Cupriavidus yeoncheonensis]|uniref:Putative NADH dehydrogenase/NAD(P)H nitroreductase LMG31506_06021 n=1 Tax=Cupriavidus yeoncheonensis TaxID=1462994 RepID=A0A916J081_9BURK|nr:malonic semialdehyde reductase [Cupriavidus yeoncheonensis]CAG2157461.1 putative malonic semialdehyde reductase RutE [Cupriavidus yeoncheonensis]